MPDRIPATAWWRDMLERAVSTWIQGFLGMLIASGMTDLDVSVLASAAFGALPAALSVIKSTLARKVPGTVSPASVATPS